MEDWLSTALAARRFSMLLAAFALLALLLAAVGIYGVVSYAAAERTRKIGIRMALGAQSKDIRLLITVQALRPILIGICVGLRGAYILTRFLKSLLFEVSMTDRITFASATLFLIVIVLAACWLPARRATMVDPLIALRCE